MSYRTSSSFGLLMALTFGISPRAHAQADSTTCANYYKSLKGVKPAELKVPCYTVASRIATTAVVVDKAADVFLTQGVGPIGRIFSQRDLQSRHTQEASTSGTAAQGQAIPSVQPTGLTAGTLAMVGTKKGDQALAAFGVNPAVLFLADTASRLLAQNSRITDLSVFVPVTTVDTTKSDGKLKYLGARLRVNFLGKSAGDAVWMGADSLIRRWITGRGKDVDRIMQLLDKAPDYAGCADALYKNLVATIPVVCGAPFSFGIDLKEAEALKLELARVREAADAEYLGADIRADYGDPTLGAVANAAGRFWFGGLAAGRRFAAANQTGSVGLRARLGVRYAKLDTLATAEYAAEGGVGIELARSVDQDEINASVAIEFRQGNAPANATDLFQTNFTMLRGSLLLPLFGSNGVSINVGVPISGTVAPIMSVNFNWGLLLPDTKTRP